MQPIVIKLYVDICDHISHPTTVLDFEVASEIIIN